MIKYLGARPISSFKLHELVAKHYRYKYSYLLYNDFAHLKPFFKKFYSLFESEVKRPFHGMNPHLHKKELVFDSCFEGGNLDCAVRLRAQEYDLLLRVDSNTAGHVLWYHFKVTNAENVGKKVKFNICNLRKNKSAYERVLFTPYQGNASFCETR
jgi:cytosolic carboxypeptidase protein 2/3